MALTAQPIYFLKSRERYYHSNSKKPWPLPQFFFFKSTFYFFSTFWWLRPYNPLIFKKLVTNIIQWRSQNLTQWVVHNCNHPIHHHHHACATCRPTPCVLFNTKTVVAAPKKVAAAAAKSSAIVLCALLLRQNIHPAKTLTSPTIGLCKESCQICQSWKFLPH